LAGISIFAINLEKSTNNKNIFIHHMLWIKLYTICATLWINGKKPKNQSFPCCEKKSIQEIDGLHNNVPRFSQNFPKEKGGQSVSWLG